MLLLNSSLVSPWLTGRISHKGKNKVDSARASWPKG